MSDNTDTGFVPSIYAKPPAASDAVTSKQQAKPVNEDTGFVPSIHSSQSSKQQPEPSTLEKVDKAVTDKLAPNPQNYSSIVRTNAIEVPKTLGREVYSAGKTIASLPGSIYHAFADEATPEEKQQYAQVEKDAGEAPGTETSGMKRLGLGIQRVTGAQSAVDAYKTYANPKTRPGYDQILENAPEALGQGAGTVVAGKAVETVAPKIVRGVKDATGKAVDVTSNAAERAVPKAKAAIERASTPKNIATAAGGAIPGAHAIGSVAGRVGSEILLGEEAANTPLIKFASRVPKGSEALGKLPVPEEPAPEAPNPLTRNMTPIGQTIRSVGLPKIGEATPKSPLAQTLEQTEASVKPAVEAAKAESTGLKPIGSEVSTKPEAGPTLKPIGTEPEPTAEEPKEVRRARHILGDAVVDTLQNSDHPQAPEVMDRLSKATHQQYADLSNALEIKKPKALSAKSGDAWSADDFRRTTKEHGKELNPTKELVVRELLNKPLDEVMQSTEPWQDVTARYPRKMSSLTERTMKALNLSEEAKNKMRASGVSDEQAQSLLAKLSKRQLNNLSGTSIPTSAVQEADLPNNASGESSASLENINRVASQKAKGLRTYKLDSRSGLATPVLANDAADFHPSQYEHKIEVDADGNINLLESGGSARTLLKSSKIRFPKEQ